MNRNEEAIAAFKKGIGLATELNKCHWLILDLGETAICAVKPEEVFAVLRLIEEKKWSIEKSDMPYTLERELTWIRAIALHMAEKDASEVEKKLDEVVSRPNVFSLRTRNLDLKPWLNGAKTSEARRAAVNKVLTMIDAPSRELVSPYFPFVQGHCWVYKTSKAEEIVTLRASDSRKIGERKYWILETQVNGRVVASEGFAVKQDGVYRQSPVALKGPVRILPLPARGGETWAVQSLSGLGSEVIGEGTTRVEDVVVPAGKFMDACG